MTRQEIAVQLARIQGFVEGASGAVEVDVQVNPGGPVVAVKLDLTRVRINLPGRPL